MLSTVVDSVTQLLSSAPTPVLDPGRIADRIPAGTGDLPAIVISLGSVTARGNGIGSFHKEGHQLTQNTAIITVQTGTGTFSDDLKNLQLPMPLRNPDDVSVVRVVGPNQTAPYRRTSSPLSADEFRVIP